MLSTPVPQQQPPYYGHYTGQPALAGTSSYELEDFVGANFYCLHSLADGNQRIQIREKMLEFSTVLSTLSLYLISSSRRGKFVKDNYKSASGFFSDNGSFGLSSVKGC